MTSSEINKSISNLKLHLTKGEKFEHWFNFNFLFVLIGFVGYSTIQNKEFSFFILILIVLIVLLLRHKFISPKLIVFELDLTEEQFKQANQATAKLNDWTIISQRKGYFSAIKGTGWNWDGIKITAILKNGKLYINSMVNPSIRSNPLTFGLNKKHKMQLISQYQSVLSGVNVSEFANKEIELREEKFWIESEWTFANTLKRILLYGLSILIMTLALWLIIKGEIGGVILGVILLGFGGTYIFYDIKVIIEKKKKKARL